ncbi:hypothetical protein [Streptomyces sp. DT203]|uniref:hypothetical protein n=1 Tax=Streptomyces sp. DT203 TaxID=3393424 RepID=UPI003CFADD91
MKIRPGGDGPGNAECPGFAEAWNRTALGVGELDPHRPMRLLHLVRRMEGVGGCFDILPESAYNEDDAGDDGLLCLLLCDQAEPGMWDWGGDAILRPYSAPRPNRRT